MERWTFWGGAEAYFSQRHLRSSSLSSQIQTFDRLTVGNDRALAFGGIWRRPSLATATNNLMIEKNQDSGECECCGPESCQECCLKVNMEQIRVGNREALAFGAAIATNNVKIVTNQQ